VTETRSHQPRGWRRPQREATHEPLTLDRIVAAAIELVDREGLDALSMRRLGTELGAAATTLYWHVRNKDELLDLALDQIFAEIEVPEGPGPWRELAGEIARRLRAVLIRHRGFVMVVASRPTTGPNALGAMDKVLGVLRRAGFDDAHVVDAAVTLVNYASGHAVLESAALLGYQEARDAGVDLRQVGTEIVSFMSTLPTDQFPNLVPLAPRFLSTDDDHRFEYGLERILDGLEAELARIRDRQSSLTTISPAER
jgi:TetR/AcrR family tetracycline transcriptional repressor